MFYLITGCLSADPEALPEPPGIEGGSYALHGVSRSRQVYKSRYQAGIGQFPAPGFHTLLLMTAGSVEKARRCL